MTAPAIAPEKTKNGNGDQQQNSLAARPEVAMTSSGFMPKDLDQAWRYADALARSQFVPQTYSGKPGDCLIAIDISMRLGVHPLAFLQNSYVVHGKPGMEAKLVITLVNKSGMFTDPLEYEVTGEDPAGKDYKVRAFATRKSTGKVLYGPWITWKIVAAEGWDKKPGSKWMTIPALMFVYRAASWFVNLHCPEIKMGMDTTDELVDIGDPKHIESKVLEPTNGTRQPFGFGQEQPPTPPQAETTDPMPGPATTDATEPAGEQAPPAWEEGQPEQPPDTEDAEKPVCACLKCGEIYFAKMSKGIPCDACGSKLGYKAL